MNNVFIDDSADYVVVGTGAGGATAARVLASTGASVILLEEGKDFRALGRPKDLLGAMTQTFRHCGADIARAPAPFPVLQGRLVGGSTAINSGICWRLPEKVRAQWVEEFGVDSMVDAGELDRVQSLLEEELGVEDTPEHILGGNDKVLREGAAKLGFAGLPTKRNAPGCKGRSHCLLGCPTGQRTSMDVSFVPRAQRDGAKLYAEAKVERVLFKGTRATGVVGPRLNVRAEKAVIVAGGAVQTPLLLRGSGLRGLVGDRFQAHPGIPILARFPFRIGMDFGAEQGYQVPLHEHGYKLESLALPPEMIAARLPGAGAEYAERLRHLGEFAQWAAAIKMDGMGRVRRGWTGGADITFRPTRGDLEKARHALATGLRMMFAAGAVEVFPGMLSRPEVMTHPDQVRLIEEGPVDFKDFHHVATHLFGTTCAHADARRGVVDADLKVHGLEGLYVMDASVFPTNTGVNPQLSIMAVSWRAAEKLAGVRIETAGGVR